MKNALNRKLIKEQAKDFISKKVFPLFLITLVVYLLVSGNTFFGAYKDFGKIENIINGGNIIEQFAEGADEDDFASYSPKDILIGGASSLVTVFTLIFGPLNVTLCATYIMLIRRPQGAAFDVGGEMGSVFKNTFNSTYLRKFVAVLIKNVILVLLLMLFIVPGVVFYMSTYFAYQLLCDYPHLRPSEALELSRKIVKGNRTELFVMNLSFFGWGILTLLSFGIIGIYAIPYKCTVDALYYENFRLRAISEGRVTKYDFMTAEEKYAAYKTENNIQ